MTIEQAMDRAIALGALGLGQTSPNPSVGAVILDASGAIVGEGHTSPAGGPHAEIVALRAAGDRARGGTAVVTLEPCNHTGRTGPCSEALIDAGVARVVVAIPDPTPLAAGGLDRLRAAGVITDMGVRATEAADAMRYWLTAVGRERPYVIWKYAATLDGRSAAADGTSQWITSDQARADVHRLRGTVDAIIAGVNTVLKDDAHLTVRVPPTTLVDHEVSSTTHRRNRNQLHDQREVGPAEMGPTEEGERRPLRVVVDSAGRTPMNARVRDGAAPTWVVTAADVGSGSDGRVDLDALMKALFNRGVRAALLEGGPTLAGAFLRAGLVDEVVGYIAPKLLGAGPAALGDAGITGIGGAIELTLRDVAQVGTDLRLTAVPKGVR
jgi:diaminohydroxyphosphoribosylaminopyrimidine deaminase/5-amino-6-(5-phosphoribosylamino)uracil reductase